MNKKYILFLFIGISLLIGIGFMIVTGLLWETPVDSTFNNGTYFNTTLDAGDFVRLDNATFELPDNQVTNFTKGINMTDNVLLFHMNGFQTNKLEFPNSQEDNILNMTGNVLNLHMNNNWLDASGIGNDGTATGAVFTTSSQLGSHAGDFSTGNNYVTISDDPSIQMNDDFSFSLWMNTSSYDHQLLSYPLGKGTSSQWALGVLGTWNGGICGDVNGRIFFFNGTVGAEACSNSATSLDEWVHVIITQTSGTTKMYINGIEEDSVSQTLSSNIGEDITLGVRPDLFWYYNGLIDEFSIWNRSLSAGEVSSIYARQKASYIDDTSGLKGTGSPFGNIDCSSPGKLGSSGCSFDGVDDYIYINSKINNNDLTYCAWANWTGGNSAVFGTPLKYSMLFYPIGAETRLYIQDEVTGQGYWSVSQTEDVWHHYCIVQSGTNTQRLYYDSEDYGTISLTNGVTTIETIGKGAYLFNGTIDEVAIWDRSLSGDEILNIYNNQHGKYYEVGEYLSEIKDLGSSYGFNNITWCSNVGELLDDQEMSCEQYANMTGNVLLMHMNDGTFEFPNLQLDDSSGDSGINMAGNVLNLHMNNDWLDVSSNGNNGTAINGASFTTDGKLGSYGGEFNGIDTYIDLSTGITATDYSISTWVKPTGTFAKGCTGGDSCMMIYQQSGIYFGLNASGVPEVHNGLAWNKANTALTLDTLQQIVITNNGTSLSFYLNGVLDKSISTSSSSLSGNSYIAIRPDNINSKYTFNGTLDEFAVWNRSLTSSEILNIYNKQSPLVQDTSGNDNNGTGYGNVDCSASGKLGSSGCNFNGNENYIDVGNISMNFGTSGFTISSWIKSNDIIANKYIIHRQDDLNSNNPLVDMYINGSGNIGFQVRGITNPASLVNFLSTTGGYDDDNWHSVVGVFDDANDVGYIYVDGQQIGSQTSKTTTDINFGSAKLSIGRYNQGWSSNSGGFLNGTIDEVAIWNRSLSSTEIENLYIRGAVELNLSVRSCDDVSCSGETWNGTYTTPSYVDISDLIDNQYFQYKFNFFSDGSGDLTSRLHNVSLDYSIADTCTYSGSGNWNVQCSDNCVIGTNYNIDGNLSLIGSGTFTSNSILSFVGSKQFIFQYSGCELVINPGGSIK